jgi:hypothetical protein
MDTHEIIAQMGRQSAVALGHGPGIGRVGALDAGALGQCGADGLVKKELGQMGPWGQTAMGKMIGQ